MSENMRKFLEKLAQDQDVATRFSACKTPDEAWELASSLQDGFTKEEFFSTMKQLKASENAGGDVSDEDLGKFAGGGGDLDPNMLTPNAVTGLPHSYLCPIDWPLP